MHLLHFGLSVVILDFLDEIRKWTVHMTSVLQVTEKPAFEVPYFAMFNMSVSPTCTSLLLAYAHALSGLLGSL